MEYLIPCFALSGPYKLDFLIFKEIYQEISQRQQVVFSAGGSELKLVLGGEDHVPSEHCDVILRLVKSFSINVLFSKAEIGQPDFMEVVAIFRAYQNVVQLQIVVGVACEMDPLVNLQETHTDHVYCLGAETAS